MKKWCYKIVYSVNGLHIYELDALGSEGWELCGIHGNKYYFKRLKE